MMYTLAQRRGQDSWHGFLMRRVKRVVPLYWLLTTVLVALMLLMPALFPNSRPDPAHTIASYLFIPYPNVRDEIYPLLVPGWTLTFEMLFYVIFASLLFLRDHRLVPALSIVFATYIIGVHLLAPESRALTWLANPILFEFVFGCFVARVYMNTPSRPAWLPHLLVTAAVLLFSASIVFDLMWMGRTLIWGVPAMLLVAGAAFAGSPAGPLSPWRRTSAALGDASYSLYLVHPFVLPAVAKAWSALGLQEILPADAYVFAATAGSCLAALCTYHIVERPLGLALASKRSEPRNLTASRAVVG